MDGQLRLEDEMSSPTNLEVPMVYGIETNLEIKVRDWDKEGKGRHLTIVVKRRMSASVSLSPIR